ncbi:MAG TPA: TolC family protein [Kofleriaceae bacterium]
MLRLGLVALAVLHASPARAEPISLREAVDFALQHHPLLERLAYDHASAAARIGRARAGLLPRLSLSGSIREDYVDPIDVSAGMPGFGKENLYNVGLTVTQLVTDSGLTPSIVEGARASERQATAQIAVSQLDIELAVVQAYLNVLQSKELLGVSTEAIVLVNEQLARATATFKTTLRPEIDVLSAKTQLSQAQLQRLSDENSIETNLVVLENAIGDDGARRLEVAPLDIKPVAEEARPVDELGAAAIAHRPELAALRDAIAAAEASVHVGERRTRPVVSLQGGVYANGGASDHTPLAESWIPGGGVFAQLGLNWDLYTGNADTYEIADALGQVHAARAELKRNQQAIVASVRQAALAVRISRESLAVSIEWRTQSERQLQFAQARYQNGVGTFVELNDARTNLVNARRQEVQAHYSLAQNRISLARELGRPASTLAAPR